jgi:hypothetical protein
LVLDLRLDIRKLRLNVLLNGSLVLDLRLDVLLNRSLVLDLRLDVLLNRSLVLDLRLSVLDLGLDVLGSELRLLKNWLRLPHLLLLGSRGGYEEDLRLLGGSGGFLGTSRGLFTSGCGSLLGWDGHCVKFFIIIKR